MKAKFGAIVVDGRGKIGGHVASKNKAGSYFRTKTTPTNPRTSAQSAVRSSFSGLAQGWRALTEAQRAGWRAGAVNFPYVDIFGDSKQLSGFGLYMQLNGNLANVGAALLDSCPAAAEIVPITSLLGELVLDASLTMTFAPTPVPANYKMVILATPQLSPGRAFSSSSERVVKVLAAATATGADIYSDYVAKFGAPTAVNNIFVSAFLVNLTTGQVSQKLTTQVVEG